MRKKNKVATGTHMRYDSNKVTAQEKAWTYVFQSSGSTATNARRRSIAVTPACRMSIGVWTRWTRKVRRAGWARPALGCARQRQRFPRRTYVSRLSRVRCMHVATRQFLCKPHCTVVSTLPLAQSHSESSQTTTAVLLVRNTEQQRISGQSMYKHTVPSHPRPSSQI